MDNKAKSKKTGSFSKNNSKKIVRGLWIAFGSFILLIAMMFTLISSGTIGYMPNVEELQNPIDKYASQIYSADMKLIGTYSQAKNNRIYSDYSDLSPDLVKALVATEDARYYSHSGIDAYALGRAMVKTIILQQSSGGGGSTIPQQLAKLLYSPPSESAIERIFLRKPIEWVIAVKLERYYTKDEIINLYLSQFDFLNNAVGIQSASQVYFSKSPKELTIDEAATLIGMCKNPSYFNPRRFPERSKGRRNVVLEQMLRYDYITKQQYDSLIVKPLELKFNRVDHKDGLAPYFREYLRMAMNAKKPNKSNYQSWETEQYSLDSLNWETNPLYGWCSKNKKPDGSSYNLATDGLRIYTTIDSRMQKYAEDAMVEHLSNNLQPAFDKEKKGRAYAPFARKEANKVDDFLASAMRRSDRYISMTKAGVSKKEIEKSFKVPVEMKVFSWRGEVDTIMTPWDSIRYHKGFLRSGFMAMDTQNGQVKAYVGGMDYNFFKYDMVNKGRRQVGSTIKPYLYALAMEEGGTPCDEMLYEPQTLITESGQPWTPRGGRPQRYGEMVTIKWGLQNSDNLVTAYLMGRTSPYNFARLLYSFGITGKIDPVVSMSLGTHDVSVAEMTAAYTAFANKGIRVNPVYVTRIEDQFGNIIASDIFFPQHHEVFSEGSYMKMIDMLTGVVNGGTGGRIRRHGVTAVMGGKTGTTQNNSDGWFMGFTPTLSTGCWVGGEDMSIHFDHTNDGQGAAMALPITGMFLKKVFDDPELGYKPTDRFPVVRGYGICDKAEQDEDVVKDTPVEIDKMFN